MLTFPSNINYISNGLLYPFNTEKQCWNVDLRIDKSKLNVVMFQDFVTFSGNTCNEIEQYISAKLDKYCVFIVPNYGVKELYPHVKIIYFNHVLWKNSRELDANKNTIMSLINPTRYKTWLCLNRIEKPHRRNTIQELLPYSSWGIHSDQQNNVDPEFTGLNYSDYEQTYNNVRNFCSLIQNYNHTRISVVTESLYADPFPFVTEKTLHAFIAGHAVIPISSKGYVDHCKQLGFLFEESVNLSYDSDNNNTRVTNAIRSNKHLFQHRLITVKHKEHNRDLAFTIHSVIKKELKENLQLFL